MTRTNKRRKRDAQVQQILHVLAEYQGAHPDCRIEVQRRNPVSIRIRIVDADFGGKNRVDRQPEVWKILKTLPEDVFVNITMLLLLTPTEAESSLASHEFDDPIPSRL